MTWKNFRENDEPVRGVLSKTLVKYTHPFDLRFSGYLIVNNHQRHNDQFVYLNSSRRIRRVNLRGEAVFGTDFTFEDVGASAASTCAERPSSARTSPSRTWCPARSRTRPTGACRTRRWTASPASSWR
jgi:hypothetical protein